VTSVLYYAGQGIGAYKEADNRTEKIPLPHAQRRYTMVGSRSHVTPEQAVFAEELRAGHEDAEVISAGSSVKFCLVAEGKADVYPRFGPTMEWDTAAGQAIVESAGGRVVAPDGRAVRYNKESLVNPCFIAYGKERFSARRNRE